MDTACLLPSQHLLAWLRVDSVAGPVVFVWLFRLWRGEKNVEETLRFLNL